LEKNRTIEIIKNKGEKMNSDKNIPRLLGAAFLFVWVVSTLSSKLLESAIGFEFGSGSISEILVNISDNLALMRVSILVELVNGIGTIVVAVLLYVILHKQNKIISLLALGWWLACVIVLAVSKIGSSALIPLSLEFVEAGAPASSFYQTLGDFLHYGFDRTGYDIHFLFFSLGGILWYYLFYRSRVIPRVLSVWGLTSMSLMLIYSLVFFIAGDRSLMILLAIHYPFELLLGLWLMVKGINSSAIGSPSAKQN
jgi:hypothetical protein